MISYKKPSPQRNRAYHEKKQDWIHQDLCDPIGVLDIAQSKPHFSNFSEEDFLSLYVDIENSSYVSDSDQDLVHLEHSLALSNNHQLVAAESSPIPWRTPAERWRAQAMEVCLLLER
ncbi:hypothetical protein SUGI_0313430 [Cryptomeria japonica]|nr:hypothetical protein SUGI_0313430 [Cryptomeria japonica]